MNDEFNVSLMHQFHRASQLADDAFSTAATKHDLTPRQFIVLSATAKHDGLSQTNIVQMTGIDRSTIADIIRRMTRAGLLSRQRTKQDARAYAVKITDYGREVLESTKDVVREVDEALLDRISPHQREEFRRSLAALLQKH